MPTLADDLEQAILSQLMAHRLSLTPNRELAQLIREHIAQVIQRDDYKRQMASVA